MSMDSLLWGKQTGLGLTQVKRTQVGSATLGQKTT